MARSKHIHSTALALAFALLGQSACFAADRSAMCNARRGGGLEFYKRIPDYERKCFEIGMELLEDATGHDYNIGEAEGIFETLLRVSPESAYQFMGYAELGMRKRELRLLSGSVYEIRAMAERATRVKAVVPQSHVTLGRADLLIGCLPCAEKSAATAQELGASGPALLVLQSLIADLRGDVSGATSRLTAALSAPGLRSEAKAGIHRALSAHHVRLGQLDDAERDLTNAVSAAPQSVTAHVKFSEFLLYLRGDPNRAKSAAEKANAVAASLEAKRVLSMTEYLAWAREYSAGKSAERIKRIAQVSFVPPEEAFVLGARYLPLSGICEGLLKAGVVRGPDVRDADSNTALIAAGMGGNGKIARELVARRANVNAQNTRGERALSWFLYNGDRDTAMTLLKAGAEIDYLDNDGNSPLSVAVQKRDAPMIVELLRRKAKTSGRDAWTAGDLLAAAVMTDDIETVKALLDGGLKVNSPDRNGYPALVTAVAWGQKLIVRLLLERGAAPEPAMEIARRTGNREILDMLRNATKRAV